MNDIPQKTSAQTFRSVIAIVLIILGIGVLLETVMRLRILFDQPESFKFFLVLLPQDPLARTITAGGEAIILPEAVFYYLTFGIAVSLLLVATLIGGLLLKRGLSLL